jgi:hypothetical protein
MIRRAAALLVLLLVAPMAANAQVIVTPAAPGPVVVVRPPVRHYHAWWRVKRFFWPHRHTVVVVPGCPTCCCPSPQPMAPPPPPPPPPPAPPAPPAPDIYAPLPPLPPPPPPLPPPPRRAPRVYAVPAAPVPTVVAPAPRPVEPFKWFGIGVRGGLTAMEGGDQLLGIGGHLRLRPSKHIAIDLAAERQSTRKGEVHRTDVPVTLGGQVYFLHGTFAPFIVGDIGVSFARASGDGYVPTDATHFVGHIGGGIELRLGRHVSLSADARYVARQRIDKEKDVVAPAGAPTTADGAYFAPTAKIGNEHGAEFRLMATLYF